VADPLTTLAALLEGSDWPLPGDEDLHTALELFAAFYDTDGAALRHYAGADDGQQYVPDPLPQKLADASSNMIFGQEPEFDSADEGDQEQLDALIDDNDLPSELQRAAAMCAAEGEVWWRILVDKEATDRPIIDWHSRASVVPLWRTRHLLACAFVSTLSGSTDTETWRYVEVHAPGIVRRLLFMGTVDKVGVRQELTASPQTEMLDEDWRHGLGIMLAGRIPNRLGRDQTLGVSDYSGVLEMLFALNEAATIGRHNAGLTLRKKFTVGANIARADGTPITDQTDAPQGRRAKVAFDDVWLVQADDELDAGMQPPKVLEYSDTWAQALIAYTGDLTTKVLTRTGIAPQLVGLDTEGSLTGPALRARLLDSIQTANGKARYWDDVLPHALMAAQLVDSLDEARGGFGRQWKLPAEPPIVRRKSILPEDPTDLATRVVALAGADLVSKRTAIAEVFPEWSDDRVTEELDALAAEPSAPSAAGGVRVDRPPIVLGAPSGINGGGRPEAGGGAGA
jgi:hypothetical protein